jgi:GcrA cell cycle regulator
MRLLRRRWRQGARVREIAAELGHGFTKNAVIAKIHRLGIAELSPFGGAPGRRYAAKTIRNVPKPASAPSVALWYRRGPPPAWVVNAQPYVEDARVDARIPRRQRRSLLQLSDGSCRWPVGDPSSPHFFFCGAPAARNKPYCAEHCARAVRLARAPPRKAARPRRNGAKRGGGTSTIADGKQFSTSIGEQKNENKTRARAQFGQTRQRSATGRAARATDAGAPAARRKRYRAR